MIDKKEIVERSHQVFHMARTLTYLGEYKLLDSFIKLFRPWVEVPPPPKKRAEIRDFLLQDIESLFKRDATLFSEGIVPWPLLKPESPLDHAKRLTRILWAGVKMSRQRKVKKSRPSKLDKTDLPDYFTRNFHWQIDGYLSEDSAAIYDHQVEILFTGTASAMRRLVIFPLNEYLKNFQGKAQILEVGSGTGELARAVHTSFPNHQLIVSDLSAPYLALAKKRLNSSEINFVEAMAEALPFPDASLDVVYSVFLFHELPNKIRIKAISEMYRVLKPKGLLILVDSIQEDEVPEYRWALESFPKDYHEPFYKSYTQWRMTETLTDSGFIQIKTERGFFSKCVSAIRPS
jgi:ubiquinone/menaquinone biosynthesis C-methylase UbiE